ncbi:putative membrane protein YmcC [Paenibacillus sp. J31TS4]|uniref:hypothetical protein n=1 Tax=Paenibacillus sp. J31TS4 TaxID=2807195 RepID=UPI001B24C02A|nr:hypothetical protein [Paenibacillus sp. J31TS4]GIP40400.1 putative membrane protein YmcC [Paenibacillus sp. J31TS4]
MSFLAWMIIACEIGFWVLIVLGLAARYLLHLDKLGWMLLACTPVVDLALLAATGTDLYRGATATQAHGLAAIYIGVSIAYGKSMIVWADERFRYYVTRKGPKPARRYGMAYAKHYLKSWLRHVLAYLIGAGLLALLIVLVGDEARTEALAGVWKLWTLILGIDLLITVSYFIWPKPAKADRSS